MWKCIGKSSGKTLMGKTRLPLVIVPCLLSHEIDFLYGIYERVVWLNMPGEASLLEYCFSFSPLEKNHTLFFCGGLSTASA